MADPAGALARALRLGPAGWRDMARATLELARARRRLGRHPSRELVRLARPPRTGEAGPEAEALVERVAFMVPRVAARVPWRADCFVQALAAQSWLARSGVASDIWIGVRRDRPPGFEAHAWLRCGDRVVTGGDVAGFVPVLTPGTPLDGPVGAATARRPCGEAAADRGALDPAAVAGERIRRPGDGSAGRQVE